MKTPSWAFIVAARVYSTGRFLLAIFCQILNSFRRPPRRLRLLEVTAERSRFDVEGSTNVIGGLCTSRVSRIYIGAGTFGPSARSNLAFRGLPWFRSRWLRTPAP